jgi:hypothetical protein
LDHERDAGGEQLCAAHDREPVAAAAQNARHAKGHEEKHVTSDVAEPGPELPLPELFQPRRTTPACNPNGYSDGPRECGD